MGIDRIVELAAPVASLEPRVDGTPLRELGWVEVAAAMARLSSAEADLMRALYLGDTRALRRCLSRLVVSFCGSPMSEDMRAAVAVVTMQAFSAQRPCEHCNGHGYVYREACEEMNEQGEWTETAAGLEECGHCEATGIDYVSLGSVRELLDVSAEVFDALIQAPFLEAYRTVRGWHDTAASRLARRI